MSTMLTKEEIAKLLVAITSVDGRQVNDATVSMWLQVLSETRANDRPWSYDEAWTAIPKWFAANDGFMSPRALIAQMRAGREELAAQSHHQALSEEGWVSEPQPVCRPHNLLITQCSDCCATLSKRVKQFPGSDLHEWACANLYRADSLVGEGAPF